MNLAELIGGTPWAFVFSGLGGAAVTLLAQAWLRRRGVFTYHVTHSRVGVSADDPIYGSVGVTWNDNPANNLFFSVIELANESATDYESVVVRIFSNNTALLSESVFVADSVMPISYSDEYRRTIAVPPGQTPTPEQFAIYNSRREYLIPVLNRGQVVRLSVLNAAHEEGGPSIWLDIQHTGVICKFKPPGVHVLGVARSKAILVGSLFGLVTVTMLPGAIESDLFVALLSFLIGWLVLLPGIGIVRVSASSDKSWLDNRRTSRNICRFEALRPRALRHVSDARRGRHVAGMRPSPFRGHHRRPGQRGRPRIPSHPSRGCRRLRPSAAMAEAAYRLAP